MKAERSKCISFKKLIVDSLPNQLSKTKQDYLHCMIAKIMKRAYLKHKAAMTNHKRRRNLTLTSGNRLSRREIIEGSLRFKTIKLRKN